MIRLTIALVGLAVMGAVFASIYYDPDNVSQVRTAPTFRLGFDEAEQTTIQPTVRGTPVVVQLTITGGPIDIYVMEKEWSDTLAQDGRLRLDDAFSYDAEASRIGVDGQASLDLVSDGVTETVLLFDNTDNHYANDTAPNGSSATHGTVSIRMTVRFVEEERRSLVLGYIAATPSVLLVAITLGRKALRHRRGSQ